jgi:glyoxylase-like metal-dependent hydrolase (beta-lactamase superfamily II)
LRRSTRFLEAAMSFLLRTTKVGPYSMNTYVIIDESSKTSAIVDPGGEPEKILKMTEGTSVSHIILTHGHFDHVLALDEMKEKTGATVCIHPADASAFDLDYDHALTDNENLMIGTQAVKIIHIPGHTPGQCSIDLGDERILVGDTIFVGGPGRTETTEDFTVTIQNMKNIVFNWPVETEFYPGHGPSGIIGKEKPSFEAFIARGWPADLHGDITWE